MAARRPDASPPVTYSLGAVSRLTGLSPHVLRAWERRYAAVTPLRTPGGTRRYREADVARLRLLGACVQAGHPIGDVAGLPERELRRRIDGAGAEPTPPLAPIVAALDRLDAEEAERLLGIQLAALGPRRFASAVVVPLLHAVGDEWERGRLCVASEHLGSVVLRNLLGGALRHRSGALHATPILFTTLAGDRHELGALLCAVVAADLGAGAIYLGPDLPVSELVLAAQRTGAAGVAVGVGRALPERQREREIRRLRKELPREVEIWIGGPGGQDLDLAEGVELLAGLEDLERKVALVAERWRGRPA
jgi:DNA-binding transcriptional MerR regulator